MCKGRSGLSCATGTTPSKRAALAPRQGTSASTLTTLHPCLTRRAVEPRRRAGFRRLTAAPRAVCFTRLRPRGGIGHRSRLRRSTSRGTANEDRSCQATGHCSSLGRSPSIYRRWSLRDCCTRRASECCCLLGVDGPSSTRSCAAHGLHMAWHIPSRRGTAMPSGGRSTHRIASEVQRRGKDHLG